MAKYQVISNGLLKEQTEEQDHVEDANMPGTLPTLRKPAIAFSKQHEEPLPSRIDRLWYINPYGQEITIPANPLFTLLAYAWIIAGLLYHRPWLTLALTLAGIAWLGLAAG